MSILKKLTIKHMTMNKKRTIVTIIGVILSTALMVGIGLLFSTVRDYMIEEVIDNQGSHHVAILNVPYNKVESLNNNVSIKEVGYEKGIGFANFEHSTNFYKPYLYVDSGNELFLKTLKLKSGRLPENNNEIVISDHILKEYNYQIGDVLNLDLGYRYYDDELIISNRIQYMPEDEYDSGEKLKIMFHKEYTVVGIVERSFYESYSAPGYQVYTLADELTADDLVTTYITYKKISKVYDKTDTLVKNLEIVLDNNTEIEYNDALITIYGESKYSNLTNSLVGIISIILGLISIGCIIVIYNSFAISVMERKKQFGLFSSIGATKKQLRKTVFYEAFFIGIIGIPLGILSGIFGIWVVLEITNYLLTDIFFRKLSLSMYPLFIIIPIFFMILVIIFSAFLPAKKASKISPIEAIRLNDDIKISGKKVKTRKIIRKLFGVEGELAFKNMKRNKKKYRITIISLFISIVLFISFSSLLSYMTLGTSQYLGEIDFDISVNVEDEDKELLNNTITDIISSEEIDKYSIFRTTTFITNSYTNQDYHKSFKQVQEVEKQNNINSSVNDFNYITLVYLDNNSYQRYLEELKLKEERPILINKFNFILSGSNRKSYSGQLLESRDNWNFSLCNPKMENENSGITCFEEISNVYETQKIPFGLKYMTFSDKPIIILSENMDFNIVDDGLKSYNILIKASKYENLEKKLNDYISENDLDVMFYQNVAKQMKMRRNLILVVKILFYGFISLVTLIGVTSVFNTINTSIALRRIEFAVLRSIGLTPQGFNRILRFETIIVGIKSLVYAIPVSLLVVYLIHKLTGEIASFSMMLIPWKSIIYAVIGVFIITSITMRYATKKIKKENILDAIREENI